MAKKEKVDSQNVSTNRNTNTNTNTNTSNITNIINIPPHSTYSKENRKPNWVVRAIVLGIITLALSLAGYYIKNSYHKSNTTIQPGPSIPENKN